MLHSMGAGVGCLFQLLRPHLPACPRPPARLQQEEGAAQAPASLHIRSALMAAVRRCMSWNNGAHAASTLQALPKDSEWLLLAPAAHDTQVHL